MKEMLIGRVHILTIFAVQWRKRNVQSRWGLAVFIQLHSFYHTTKDRVSVFQQREK